MSSAAIAAADAVLLASPVYRASFTGALKNLLDLTPVEALRAKPVGIVAMGATLHHYLGVDWQLRAVLAWFGALVVPTSVYLESGHFQDGQLADPAARAALGRPGGGARGDGGPRPRSGGPAPIGRRPGLGARQCKPRSSAGSAGATRSGGRFGGGRQAPSDEQGSEGGSCNGAQPFDEQGRG